MSAQPDAGLEAARLQVAQDHGLTAQAMSFISGDTLDEMEANAAELARLLDAGGGDHATAAAPNPFANLAAAKQERQRHLRALFSGRTTQPRDERGRFASSLFDGGARQPLPVPRDPERDHGELLGQLVAARRIFGGSDF